MHRSRNALILLLVLLATVFLYAELWNTPPLSWDDGSNIFANPYFRMGHWWGVWTEPYYGLYVPITSSVWAALLFLGKGAVWPFRLLNLSLHVANIILVFLILREFMRRWSLPSAVAMGVALAVFALHPLQVQAVAWLSGARDLLAAFFTLAAVLIYFRFENRLGHAGALALFVLSLLSKPNVAVMPAVMVCLEVLLRGRTWWVALKRTLPWWLAAAGAIVLTQIGQGAHFENTVQWWQRPLLMLDSYRFYLEKLVWPHPLSANYARTPESVLGDGANIWKALLTLAAILGASVWAWRRDRRFLFFGLWFLLLLPVSGLVPFAYENIGGVADHYNYLPLVTVAILLLPILQGLSRWPVLYVFPLAAVAGLTYTTWARLPVWEGDTSFFMDMARMSPDSYNTALGMSVVMCEDIKDYAEGVHWTEKALAKHPNDIMALANQAVCYSRSAQTAKVIEMEYYLAQFDREKLALTQPTAYASFLASLGHAFAEAGKFEEGFRFLCEAYRVLPSEPAHARNLEAGRVLLRAHGLSTECKPLELE
jgi:hypothetical protein